MNYIDVLRRFLLGEYGGVNNDAAQNEDAARQALADIAGLSKDDPMIDVWIRDAGQIVGPDLSPSATSGVVTTPTGVPDTSQIDAPVVSDSLFATPTESEQEARERLELQRGGRQLTFRDFIGKQFNPGASPFLREGLESRFNPLNLQFMTREALGENVVDPITGGARSFQDWLGTYNQPGGSMFGESRPTVNALQGLATRALGALQGGFEAGTGAGAQTFLQDPQNQFQLALQSRLGSVAPFLRENFAKTARDRFNTFITQNPQRAGEYLAEFMGPQGGRF